MNDKKRDITLDDIARMKDEKRRELEVQREKISKTAQALFAPVKPAVNSAESIARLFNRGMAMFDGVMMGMKVMAAVRSFFFRKKKRR